MTTINQQVKAVHLEGGNYFDDMRINIMESHNRLDNLSINPMKKKKSKYCNIIKLYLTGLCIWFGIYEFLVVNGIIKRWFDDFRNYWSNMLNGRPFWNIIDFFMLLYDYRKRQQYTSELEWNDAEQHLVNWQQTNQLYSTLHNVRKLATHPIVNLKLWKNVSRGNRILEYGCSLAPYYYCYREFFSHLDCKWVLADIPSFPFHYAKYLYRNDLVAEFVTINAEDFSNPLGENRDYDIVIISNVLEHLDNPQFVTEYLLNRLKPDGLFVFDYIKSEGKGLDHPNALEMREDCIKNILEKTRLVHGKINDNSKSIGMCIAQKKSV